MTVGILTAHIYVHVLHSNGIYRYTTHTNMYLKIKIKKNEMNKWRKKTGKNIRLHNDVYTFMVVHVNKFMWQSPNIYSFDSIKDISIKYRHLYMNRHALKCVLCIRERKKCHCRTIRWNLNACIPNTTERIHIGCAFREFHLNWCVVVVVFIASHRVCNIHTFCYGNYKVRRGDKTVQWIIGLIFMAFNLHSIAFLFPHRQQ